MTAVQLLHEIAKQREPDVFDWEQARQMEEQRLRDAIMYALDEDGHTGDWKIKFVDDYIKKISKQTPERKSKMTWDEIEEEYAKDEYPVFGGPFTNALTPWEWLKLNCEPPAFKDKPL